GSLHRQGTAFRASRNGCPVILLFDNLRKHKPISMTGDGSDEARLARIVAERPTDRANGLAQRAVGNNDVVPHTVEDVPPVYRLVPPLDEKHEQIEVARDERLLQTLAKEGSAARREDEIAEAIPRHSSTMLCRLRRNCGMRGSWLQPAQS